MTHKHAECDVIWEAALCRSCSEEILFRGRALFWQHLGVETEARKPWNAPGFFPCPLAVEWHLLPRQAAPCCGSWPPGGLSLNWQHVRVHGRCFFCASCPPALKTCCCLPNFPSPPFMYDWQPRDCFEISDSLQALGGALSFSTQVCLASSSAPESGEGGHVDELADVYEKIP